MRLETKTFENLTKTELYTILQLRSAVFVVEQNCVYQDIDGKDQKALHLLGYAKETLVAYTRIFAPGDYFDEVNIGRVVVHPEHRAFGYGKDLMGASIEACKAAFGGQPIRISAQQYLLKFYNGLGFTETGEGYLEDGIPHVNMVFSFK
jgi:ElaA protein